MKQPLYVRESISPEEDMEDIVGRLETEGVESLRDGEVLAVALGLVPYQAKIILDASPLGQLATVSFGELKKTMEVEEARRLICCVEFARRGLNKGLGMRPVIACPQDAIPLISEFREEQREHFICLYLNSRNQVIHKEVVSIGSLSASIVHPREVFKLAIARSAASVVVAHNHPSGDCSPSKDDIELTRRLVRAGEIMGIDVLDHLIISQDDFLSLKERGLI